MGYVYIDSTPVNDGSPYLVDWDLVDFGTSSDREPNKQETVLGSFVVYPIGNTYQDRKGKFAMYASALDVLEKFAVESTMRALLSGSRRLHIGGRFLDVVFLNSAQVGNDARKSVNIAGIEVDFIAYKPLWKLNQPLGGVAVPTVAGVENSLYDDNSIPTTIPPFVFTANTFTLNNWGTARAEIAGTVTDGPVGDGVNSTIYLTGPGGYVQHIVLNAGGDGTFLETPEFYLEPGDNALDVRLTMTGTLITPSGTFSISFANTYMRFR